MPRGCTAETETSGQDELREVIEVVLRAGAVEEDSHCCGVAEEEEDPATTDSSRKLLERHENGQELQGVNLRFPWS